MAGVWEGSKFWERLFSKVYQSPHSREATSFPRCSNICTVSQNIIPDMRQSRVRAEDARLEVERRLKCKGTARVNLDVLHFLTDEPREPDAKHVEFLKGCFRKEGCRPLEVKNHVPAIIDQRSLDAAMRNSKISARELLTNEPNGCPELVFPAGFHLPYLHGLHRIQAGREFLSPRDKWWAVDLYLSGEFRDLLQNLTAHCQLLHQILTPA